MSTETLIQGYPLKREKIIKKTLGWTVGSLTGLGIFSLVIASVALKFIPAPVFASLAIVIFFIITAVAYLYESEYFRKYFYDLTEEGIVISKGVFTTHKIIVPPQKVQDVYLDQDLLDRAFGLWDLHISSATETSGIEAHIDGVSRENALALREILMKSLLPESASAVAKPEPTALGSGGALLKQVKPSSMGLVSLLTGSALGFLVMLGLFFEVWPIAILFGLAGFIWAYLDFTVLRYELREDGVFIRRGFITRSENLFLYRNIQDVQEIAGLWDRLFGLKAISLKTMTSSSVASALMPYIAADSATSLREEIIALSKKESQKAERKAKAERPKFAAIAGGTMALQMDAEDSLERPKIDEKEVPYKNNFYRGATYALFVYGALFIPVMFLFAITLVSLGQGGLAILGIGAAIGLGVLAAGFLSLSAFLSDISFRYTISTDFILVKTGILNILKKQINYNKIQDLEMHIGFSQSFAKLATLKIETGSREVAGSHGETASAITQNETIPDLGERDAEELKKTILAQMGISEKGIGTNPLVSRLPLESIKPLKKTFWWAFYSLMLVVLAAAFAFLFAAAMLWLVLVLITFLGSACVLKYIYEHYYYHRYFYDLNEDVLVIKKGVFGSRELTVSFEKIQDVFIDRDWLDLFFGLYDVYVTTVTSRSILNAHIDGVNEANAEKIAQLLLKRIKA